MNWIQTVKPFKKAIRTQSDKLSGKPAKKFDDLTVVSALTGWLNSEITEYTEGSSEAVSRRAVWIFPNDWALTFGTGITPLLSHLTQKVDPKAPPIVEGFEKWFYNGSGNGWSYLENLDSERFLQLIKVLEAQYGEAYVGLPWRYWIEQTVDQGKDYYSYYLDKAEKLDVRKSFFSLMKFLSQETEFSRWKIVIGCEDDFLSEYSAYVRFFSMVNDLEESGEWLVIIDEHCASCCHGTREFMIEENPDLKNKPEFLTWGQNSQNSYTPDGGVYTEIILDDPAAEKELMLTGMKYGFHFDIPDNDEDFQGSVTFEK